MATSAHPTGGRCASGNKIDWILRRSIDYRPSYDRETGAVSAKLTVTLDNAAPPPAPPVPDRQRTPGAAAPPAQAGANGAFSTSVTIPASATAGVHTIVATGVDASGRARELTSTVTVLGVQLTRGDSLPRTGASFALPAGLAGAVLMAVGSRAVVASRRRRTTA